MDRLVGGTLYYFYRYATRLAPAVMMPRLLACVAFYVVGEAALAAPHEPVPAEI